MDINSIDRDMVYILAAAGVLLVLIFIVAKWSKKLSGLDKRYFVTRWNNIQSLVTSEATWQQAVIDGDKLVDEALKRLNIKGNTMGERLVSASKQLNDQDSIWRAHKLRNKLVHETDIMLTKKQLAAALNGYKKALKDLGAL